MKTIFNLGEITNEWISGVLAIDPDTINKIDIHNLGNMPISQAAIINIDYKSGKTNLPNSLFIKIPKEKINVQFDRIGKKEVYFYNNIGSSIGLDYIPKNYYSNYDLEEKTYNIVLEDLSISHFQTEYPIIPGLEYCKMAIESLAKIHSVWWDNIELEKMTSKFKTKEDDVADICNMQNAAVEFIYFLGDRLGTKRSEILKTVSRKLERLDERYLTHKNLTLTHGDTHYWNFLFPKGKDGRIKIIDWDSYENGIGAMDIAYMIALHWFPTHRKEYEMELLELYHNSLVNNGVVNYSFSEFIYDYKWAVINLLFVPVFQWKMKLWAGIWYNHIERIFSAYEDLYCNEIIE
jgi:thiamine kinase-like enzyme